MSFRRYVVKGGKTTFQLVLIWTSVRDSFGTDYQQAHQGLMQFESWIRSAPTVLLGDFNNNAAFKKFGWTELVSSLTSLGLESAYHRHFAEA